VHCSILRGSDCTLVRCWSPNTRLNGSPFLDARLVIGDRLHLADWELEVLDTASQEIEADDADATDTPNDLPSCADQPVAISDHDSVDGSAELSAYIAELLGRLGGCNSQSLHPADSMPLVKYSAEQTGDDDSPTDDQRIVSPTDDALAACDEPTANSDESTALWLATAVVSGDAPVSAVDDSLPATACVDLSPSPQPELAHPVEVARQPIRAERPDHHLHAMRELANASARNAILHFDTRQSSKDLLGKASVAILGMLCAILMAYWTVIYGQWSMLLGALSGMLVAVVWGIHTMRFSRKLKAIQGEMLAG
jgi:hypothetical protein